MPSVSSIMSSRVVTIPSDCDLSVAVDTFLRTSVRHLVVVTADRRVLGVLSADQVVETLDASGLSVHRLVGDVVVAVPERVRPADDIRRAVALMLDSAVGALAVVEDDGQVVGVLTWSDIVAHVTGMAS